MNDDLRIFSMLFSLVVGLSVEATIMFWLWKSEFNKVAELEERVRTLEEQLQDVYLPEQRQLSIRDDKAGYVYLAACSTGHYKIGVSIEPFKRIKHFNTIMPVDVTPVHFIACNHYKSLESFLHRLFSDRRVKGEWFDLEASDVDFVCDMQGDEWDFGIDT